MRLRLPRHWNIRLRATALLTALGVAAVTFAQPSNASDPGAYAIHLQPAVASKAAANLTVNGTWPTQCPPTFENVSLNGEDLRVDARSMLGQCARQSMPFAIELNPALALQQATLTAGVYHVSFFAANGAQAQPQLRAFALVDNSAPTTAAIVPESGFWWTNDSTQSNNHTVLSMELQGKQLSVALMSYAADGRASWQFGTAALDARTAHVALLRLEGGSDPFSAAATTPRGEPGLTLDLDFKSSAHAAAWLSRPAGSAEDPSIELQSLDLVRLPFSDAAIGSAWQGDWVLVSDGDQTAPLRIRLEQPQVLDGTSFSLRDNLVHIALDCQQDALDPELPPQHCVLRQANGVELGRLDNVGIGRMDGVRADGAPWHLLRISH